MKGKKNKQEKIKELLASRGKITKRLREINKLFKQEKENEDFWPGHEGTTFQSADSDYQVLVNQLSLINKELKRLGIKPEDFRTFKLEP